MRFINEELMRADSFCLVDFITIPVRFDRSIPARSTIQMVTDRRDFFVESLSISVPHPQRLAPTVAVVVVAGFSCCLSSVFEVLLFEVCDMSSS